MIINCHIKLYDKAKLHISNMIFIILLLLLVVVV